jgi:hypothetical protein
LACVSEKKFSVGVALWFGAVAVLGGCSEPPASEPTTENAAPVALAEPDTSLSYFNFAKAVLDRECAGCHVAPGPGAGRAAFRLDSIYDVNGVPGVLSVITKIDARLADGTMPPAGSLTATERRQLRGWIAAGAPVDAAERAVDAAERFVKPATDETAQAEYVVEVQLPDKTPGSTWDLFWSHEAGATSGGTSIATGLPATAPTYALNTGAFKPGTYHFYAVWRGHAEVRRFAAAGAVRIDATSLTQAP